MTERFAPDSITDYLDDMDREYLYELSCLQVELLSLQRHILNSDQRLLILFEGRDTAGKGGAIFRFRQHLIPHHATTVALTKPTEAERGQWYFQRYIKRFPNAGHMAFFDRSWYNRAIVEPVMGFCTAEQYQAFMSQVTSLERFWVEDGIHIVKLWFSINRSEQQRRLDNRTTNPLKAWKLSPVDRVAQQKWQEFTEYKARMFERTSTEHCPWVIIDGNAKKTARTESIRYVLSLFDYPDKGMTGQRVEPDPDVVDVFRPKTTS